jgi:hypothetical protein
MSAPSRAGVDAAEIDRSAMARAFDESPATPDADEHKECIGTARPLGRAMIDLILADDAPFISDDAPFLI